MRPWLEESPGDVKKLSFSSRSVKLVSWVPQESEMVCASGTESCYSCALRSHQKKCVLRSGLHTSAETVGPRETRPHGRSAQGFPNSFMSQTCKQMRTIEPTALPRDSDTRVCVGKFLPMVFKQPIAEQFKLSI